MFGISVAEKKILWLKVRAEGIAGHGSQPHDQNPNDRLTRALARLLAQPLPTSPFAVLDTMKARVGPLAVNKFNNAIQHSTISITSLRSGVGDPPKANVIPSVAEATLDCRVLPGTTKDQWLAEIAAAPRRSRNQDRDHLRRGRSDRDDAGLGAVPGARVGREAAAPGCDRDADDGPLRDGLERLPSARGEEPTASRR